MNKGLKLKAKHTVNSLLLEIGTEEIPARFVQNASNLFKDLVVKLLKGERIPFEEEGVESAFTPRRLAVFVSKVSKMQQDRIELIKGPPLAVALDPQGKWTQAAVSFSNRQGVSLQNLVRKTGEKGEYLYAEKTIAGKSSAEILKERLGALIQEIKFPKSMHWDEGALYFSRPVRWLVALFGTQVLKAKLGPLESGRASFGYRWAKDFKFSLERGDWALYLRELRKRGVVADFDERLKLIQGLIKKLLGASKKIHEEDFDLLVEVANLVECPNVALGRFDEKYLKIPPQVLSTVIKYHQKYLPVYEACTDRLLPCFVLIFNGPRSNTKTVIQGNEKVLRARLADAAFFWEQDRKVKFSDGVPLLKNVVFQEKLGSYHDKVERLVRLAQFLRGVLNLSSENLAKLERSALLCKADLVTQMVGEFTSLQGVIGEEYVRASGEDPEIALAIREHYLPGSGMEGSLPTSFIGALLALIDKLDTVVGCFQVGLAPSGSQDPYGLRRHSSGILRILYEKNISVSLKDCIHKCNEIYGFAGANSESLYKFFQERLENLFLANGFNHEIVRSVIARQSHNPAIAYKIVKDLQKASNEAFFPKAVTIVERTYNISKGQAIDEGLIDENQLKEPEELELYRAYKSNYDGISKLISAGNFFQATSSYADVFYAPVHVFFDKVLVNVEEEALRQNRYRLLKHIHELYASQIADLSKISVARIQG